MANGNTRAKLGVNKVTRSAVLLVIGLIAIVLIRLGTTYWLYRSGFACLTADEFGRPFLAAQWATKPVILTSGWWLPHFSYIYGIALRLIWNLLWVPRLLTVGFGILSLILIYLLTLLLTKSKWAGLASALLLMANPLHTWFSAVALSDSPSWFFCLGFFTAFVCYLNYRKDYYLILAGICLLVANGLRLETWALSGLFCLFLASEVFSVFHHNRRWNSHLTFTSISGIMAISFPLFWTVASYIGTGNPFATIANVESYKASWYGNSINFLNYPRAFWQIEPIIAISSPFLYAFGFFQYKKNQPLFIYTAMSFCLLAVFIVVHGGRSDPEISYQRYLAFYLFLLYPLLFAILKYFVGRFHANFRYVGVIPAIIIFAYSAWHAGQAFHFSNDPSVNGLRAGQYLKYIRNTNPGLAGKPVLIEQQFWDYLAFHIGSNDISQIYYDRALDIANRSTPSLFITDPDEIRSCIAKLKFSTIIVRSSDIKAIVEKDFGLTSFSTVNDYSFYQVPGEMYSVADKSLPPCVMMPGTGY